MEVEHAALTTVIANPPAAKQYLKNSISFETLLEELRKLFSSDSVNIEQVKDLMLAYRSDPKEWKKYAKFDRYRYTRNLVDEGNGKYNLMILCWGEGHGSAIHDHADAHCFMKNLQGTLSEVRFAWPTESTEEQELQVLGRNSLGLNQICYINDSMGLHRVENPSHTERAVSLHLYCPPFDACNVFNARTGQRTKCPVTFWSRFGEKRNKEIQATQKPEDN
ncbi:hypothetical protein B566_EDAN001576 [Ephemera danica]|nr:hypothetical protein B566_EDAN001576 [Ephemera danica]